MEKITKELIQNVNELLIDVHKFKNEPTILINIITKFQDDNVELLHVIGETKEGMSTYGFKIKND